MVYPVIIFLCVLSTTCAQWPTLYRGQQAVYPPSLLQLRHQISKPIPPSFFGRYATQVVDDGDIDDLGDDGDDGDIMKLPSLTHPMAIKTRRFPPLLIRYMPSYCGKKIYNPHKQFCYRNRPYNTYVYGTCGPRLYRKPISFCFKGQTYNRLRKGICIRNIYDKLSQVCQNGKIMNICAGEIFNPGTHFCYERIYNRVNYAMCGKRVYRKSTHYCMHGQVLAKLKPFQVQPLFTPKELQLWGRSIRRHLLKNKSKKWFQNYNRLKNLRKKSTTVVGQRKNLVPTHSEACGRNKYNPKSHFCYNNVVTPRCGLMAYNPDTLVCFRNFLYTKGLYGLCGSGLYNKYTQSCLGGHVYQRDLKRFPQLEKLFLDYNSERDSAEKEERDIFNLSKQLAAKRRSYREKHGGFCGFGFRLNKRSHFCYNGKLYNRSVSGMCGKIVYNKQSHRCLSGAQLFPIVNTNKPLYYLEGAG